jgi:hypothetical protein
MWTTSNIRVFKRLWITHLLNVLIEIMDPPPLVEILIYIFLWPCSFQEKKSFCSWKKFLLPLGICNKKISLFVNPLHTYKETKHRQHLEALQKSHNSTCQKSLMAHTQNFEVSSTKYVSSSNFINIVIQMTRPKLDSLAPYYQTQL